jgi:hypothetical protein
MALNFPVGQGTHGAVPPNASATALREVPGVQAGVGLAVGAGVGSAVGFGLGAKVGLGLGTKVGLGVGVKVGAGVGDGVGASVGDGVGDSVGITPRDPNTSRASSLCISAWSLQTHVHR